jgi:FecR protein
MEQPIMKKLIALTFFGGLVLPSMTQAIDLKESKFTQVVNSVEVVSASDQTSKAATVNDVFKLPDVVRTGANSRAELVADDKTVTRIGANTVFSFDQANRTIDLKQGNILFHAPHGKGGGTIHTGSATAAVLGTTIIVSATADGGFKVLDLEGSVKIQMPDGTTQTLQPGEMVFVLPGGGISPVIVFNLNDEVKGSNLVNGFDDPLPSMDNINSEVEAQLLKIFKNDLEDTGVVIVDGFGGDTGGAGGGGDAQEVRANTVPFFLGNILIGKYPIYVIGWGR